MQQEMFNSLLIVATMSAVWFPHGVEAVDVFVCPDVSRAGFEDPRLVLSAQVISGVSWIWPVHESVEGSSFVSCGPSVKPFFFTLAAEDSSTGL